MKNIMKKIFLLPIIASLFLLSCQQKTPISGEQSSDHSSNESSESMSTVTDENIPYESIRDTTFENLRFSGRVLRDETGVHLDWTYSGFLFQGWFEGDITADVKAVGQLGYLLHIIVDGQDTSARYSLDDTNILLATVEKGYHTIEVRKTTEGSTATVTLQSLNYFGKMDSRPSPPALKMEFIGDSITCGVGAKAEQVTDTNWNYLRDCDSYLAFSTMTARNLDADCHLTAVSGWGIIRGSTDMTQKIPSIYSYTSYIRSKNIEWDFSLYQPDVVVIGLGTNDTPYAVWKQEEYIQACRDFLTTVREKNPNAYIVWVYGMMNNDLAALIQTAVSEQNDAKLSYLSLPCDQSGGWGHPDLAAQKEYAAILTEYLQNLLPQVKMCLSSVKK